MGKEGGGMGREEEVEEGDERGRGSGMGLEGGVGGGNGLLHSVTSIVQLRTTVALSCRSTSGVVGVCWSPLHGVVGGVVPVVL